MNKPHIRCYHIGRDGTVLWGLYLSKVKRKPVWLGTNLGGCKHAKEFNPLRKARK